MKNENNITELVFILDRSGSMGGLESDTIGGFNAMIQKQKKQEGTCWVSTVLFDHESQVLHDRLPLAEVPLMTDRDYTVRGCTALLDAIGDAIHHIANIHKYAREEDRPEKTIFVITTDGMENASRMYTYDKVRRMITREQEEYHWEFIFLGANIDAAKESGRLGIRRGHSANYHSDTTGTRLNYDVLSNVVGKMRKMDRAEREAYFETGSVFEAIDKDYEERK